MGPKVGLRRQWLVAYSQQLRPEYAPSARRIRVQTPPPFPVLSSCPETQCDCASMPEGLDIDRQQLLNGTMAAYSQQVLISTGRSNWTSRIEDDGVDEGWGELTRGLKRLLGRGGRYMDPYNNVLITASNLTASPSSNEAIASALVLPSFNYIPSISTDEATMDAFVRAFLLPESLHRGYASMPAEIRATIQLRDKAMEEHFPSIRKMTNSPVVLICGHGGRDQRCGIMGPLLQQEFAHVLERKGFQISHSPVDQGGHACIGQISHIGGHKYAGNVIIYVPPSYKGSGNQLAGAGIWYGRVQPKHVDGIVNATILEGKRFIAQQRLATEQDLMDLLKDEIGSRLKDNPGVGAPAVTPRRTCDQRSLPGKESAIAP
ncbi:hypothetical protein KEM54_005774 [Ascosphaera aggregata]|nr:hypothetical protein KEM54_005774 [Ascosphaera aggregata]